MKKITIPAVAAAVLAFGGCGGDAAASHPKVHIHGSFAEVSLVNGNCGLSPGDQVKITSAGGKVLAIPALGTAVTRTIKTGGVSVPMVVYPFSATVPAEARYGITVGSMPVYYASQAHLRKGVGLTC
jgi:hypothetical protein